VIRSGLRKPDPESGDDELEFTWEQTAYLAGGYPRLTTAAIARLVEREFAAVASDSERLVPGGKLPAREDLSPAEHAVYSALPFGNKPADLKPVHEAVEAAFSTRASRLEDDGFVLPRERQVALALASLAPLLLVLLAFAVPRLVMGLAHDKPVTFLVIAGIMGLVFGIPFCVGRTIRLTYRGENLLVWLRAKHGSLTTSGAADAAMGVALFGTAALAVSSIPFLQTWYPRQTSDAGGGCGSGCGSGDGGGGCGGGGCGGCGGD
jgi:uncharacterized protein (TIGR04222 family)